MLIVYLPLVVLIALGVLIGFLAGLGRYHSPEQSNARGLERDEDAHRASLAARQKDREAAADI